MTPVQCATCRHFQLDPLNVEAGMGRCDRGHGYWFPGEVHRCGEHELKEPPADE